MIALLMGFVAQGELEPLPHMGTLSEGLRAPARLALSEDGSVYVTDPFLGHVAQFDASGGLVAAHAVAGGPVGLAIHPDGRFFVSLAEEPRVAIFDAAWALTGYLGEEDESFAFLAPTDIDIDPLTGRVYVVDGGANNLYVFGGEGGADYTLGERGKWPGQFQYLSAIALDVANNRVLIADHDNFRLQVFSLDGVYLNQFGDRLRSVDGDPEGWLPRPLGIAVDGAGYTFVTDSLMGTVRVFDARGIDVGKVIGYGYDTGDLRVPCDVAVNDDATRLYVVSTNASTVEVYGTDVLYGELDGAVVAGSEQVRMPAGTGAPSFTYESAWSGPHVLDPADLCARCHGINGQGGGHAGTAEGQSTLCMSCHSSGGRALGTPIHEADRADPFGTNDNAADGRGRSHAWGVPAMNADADAVGPGAPMSWFLADGNIKCSTCHNQHNDSYGSDLLRTSNEGDAMCKQCHAPRDVGPGGTGTHAVGFDYPADTGEYPGVLSLGMLPLKSGMVECTTCHAVHGADSGGAHDGAGDGMLLRMANDERLCRTCHTDHAVHGGCGDTIPTCTECHGVHDLDSTNIALIASEVNGEAMSFTELFGGYRDYVHLTSSPGDYDGICEVCHTTTSYHRNNASGDHSHNIGQACTYCHEHDNGFMPTGEGCTDCHGEPPSGSSSPNRAGSHATHMTGARGPQIQNCDHCHTQQCADTHDNGQASFVSGVDANGDGEIDLDETDVCDACHSPDGLFDGVTSRSTGAKRAWLLGAYTPGGDLLDSKKDWCLGCHDDAPSVINGVAAVSMAGDNVEWGYKVDAPRAV